jgi:hypothetical protein
MSWSWWQDASAPPTAIEAARQGSDGVSEAKSDFKLTECLSSFEVGNMAQGVFLHSDVIVDALMRLCQEDEVLRPCAYRDRQTYMTRLFLFR